MHRRTPLLAVVALTTSLLTACGSGSMTGTASEATLAGTEGRTDYPLTITDNCGVDVTIEKAPERAVSVNQGSTEILLSLGLQDRMVGTATWTDAVRPNLAAANAEVPRLGDDAVSYERVLKEEPDLVTASFAYALDGDDPDRRAQYARLGVPTYLAPSHCDGRTDASGDGPRDHPLEMDVIYEEITQLAEIFDVPSRGEALVAELKQRMADAAGLTPGGDVSIAYWFANTELPYMAGANGSPGVMSRTVGVENVFDDTDVEWPQISWESVLDRDPDVIALGDLARDQQTGDRLEDKIRFLETDPVTKQLTAVREKRYVVLNGADMNPSIRTVDGTEKLAKALVDLGMTG
ncbi:ABC transporter substrate-binding protein [Aeromicrobium fastidiosum]|uniref:ABC transporter substrate-binding protein n=1 Tax=Aeromicrobium fastidiosum TaxID=52699 RepID=UPI002023889B|nr:ABC transporter substrate-binding protein [Aeromicrobium fastidiosum]MCL8249761.1 ABC transporter substrate-binding protein [Aeromicrobium fastidiosum]